MAHTHQAVAFDGAFEFLKALHSSSTAVLERAEVVRIMRASGVCDPQTSLQELAAASLLVDRGESLSLTRRGIRTTLLLEAINGADLADVYHRLSQLDAAIGRYELVREGMTRRFIEDLRERPRFGTLYLCSPWIALQPDQVAKLTSAVRYCALQRGGIAPEILVITRPADGAERRPPESVAPLQKLGAAVFLNRRLHAKVYIREPDETGGHSVAIVGSQNLTGSNYIELGIKVNSDERIMGRVSALVAPLGDSTRRPWAATVQQGRNGWKGISYG